MNSVISVLVNWCIVSSWKLQCPDRSQIKTRANCFCNVSSLGKYTCLFNKNNRAYEESCALNPDFVPPGKKYVIKGIPAGENCEADVFQPVKLWLNESSECQFYKDKCSAEGQTISTQGTTHTDRKCRCNSEKGFAFIQPPTDHCFCKPFQEDCSCYLKTCLASEKLASDYTCVSLDNLDRKCQSYILTEVVDSQTSTVKSIRRLIVDSNNIEREMKGIIILIMVAISFALFCLVFLVLNDSDDDVDSFKLKLQGNWKSLRSTLLEKNGNILQDMLDVSFITEAEKASLDNRPKEHLMDYVLISMYENSKSIFTLSKKNTCKWGGKFVYRILQSRLPITFTAHLNEPADGKTYLKQWLRDNVPTFCEVVDPKNCLYDFVEKLVFDISDLKKIINCETRKGICDCFLITLERTEEKGSFQLLEEILFSQKGLAQKMIIEARTCYKNKNNIPKTPSISLIQCLIHEEDERQVHSGLLTITILKSSTEALNTLSIQQVETIYDACRVMVLQELAFHTFKTSCSGLHFNVLNHTTVNTLRKRITDVGLTKVILTYMKSVSPIIEQSGQSLNLELMLDINDRSNYKDEIEEKNNTLTNCAGDCRMTSNIITMNRQIIMEEMDTEIAIKALQNKGCDTSDITGSRDEKKTKILEILEKDEFFYLPSFLNELQRHELDFELLYKRLNICQEVFSSKIDKNTLRDSILRHVSVIVSSLVENNCLFCIYDILKERKVLCEGCIYLSNQNHTDELQTLEMIVYLIRKGKDAMLHFVDALHQCEIDEYKLVFERMKTVQNKRHSTDPPNDEKMTRKPLSDGLIVSAKFKFAL